MQQQRVPYSEVAEQCYLCSIILSKTAWLESRRVISPKHFFDDIHRSIFAYVGGLRSRGVELLEFPLIREGLHHIPLELLSYIYGVVPSGDNWKHYASIILKNYDLRRILSVCDKACREIGEHDPDLGRIIDLRREFYESKLDHSFGTSAREAVSQLYAELEGLTDETVHQIIPVHLPEVAEILPGYRAGQLILVGGFRSAGKSSWLKTTVVRQVVPAKVPVLIFSFEVSAVEFISGLLSILSKVPITSITFGNLSTHQIDQMAIHHYALADYDIQIIDEPCNIYDMCAMIETWVENKPFGFIGVDYAQLTEETGKRGKSQEGEISLIGRMLKVQASKNPKTVIMLLTQLNVDGNSKYARALEEHCNTFIRVTSTSDDSVKIIDIAKQRSGPTGQIEIDFWKTTGEFY